MSESVPVLAEMTDLPDASTWSDKYPVIVANGALGRVGGWLARVGAHEGGGDARPALRLSRRCAIITNAVVGPLYSDRVCRSLSESGFDPRLVAVPDGEAHKTLATVNGLYDRLMDEQLDRRSAILALGGGVIGDMAGFVAATYWRGVPFVQLPTTLLAMVDASIGGKVAVDHARGKNLIGAFKSPLAVFADPNALASLPIEEWRSGLAEVVKHALIGDADLFQALEKEEWGRGAAALGTDAELWLKRAIRVKIEIVTRDPFEQGERAKLNLGHTVGHALEALSGFRIRHGEGVAIGLVCATRLAQRRNVCTTGLVARVEAVLHRLGLPTHIPSEYDSAAVWAQMRQDKKRIDGRLRMVLPIDVGQVVLTEDVGEKEMAAVIEASR